MIGPPEGPVQESARWVVLKFGGTSVASGERWEAIAKILRQRISDGMRPLVVCSAVSQVSNRLEAALAGALVGERPASGLEELASIHTTLAAELGIPLPEAAHRELASLGERLVGISLTGEASCRLRAEVLAAGELLATRIGAAWLVVQGLPTRWLDARELLQADRSSDDEARQFLSATCDHTPDPALQERLAACEETVLLTQGFVVGAPDGGTALLGRGGSDTSATSLAAKVGADHAEIWTDVPGLFTADPRVVPDALKLHRVGYEEATELATRGAKVLHPRSLAPARDAGIPVHVCHTADPSAAGTVIDAHAALDRPSALAISSRTGMAVVAMDVEGTWQQVGVLADITACFARHGLSIDSIASSQTRVTASLDPAAHPLEAAKLDGLLRDLEAISRPRLISPVASISVVGTHLRCVLHDLPSIFRVLEARDVHLIAHAAHDHSLTFIVEAAAADAIVRELHRDLVRVREGEANA